MLQPKKQTEFGRRSGAKHEVGRLEKTRFGRQRTNVDEPGTFGEAFYGM